MEFTNGLLRFEFNMFFTDTIHQWAFHHLISITRNSSINSYFIYLFIVWKLEKEIQHLFKLFEYIVSKKKLIQNFFFNKSFVMVIGWTCLLKWIRILFAFKFKFYKHYIAAIKIQNWIIFYSFKNEQLFLQRCYGTGRKKNNSSKVRNVNTFLIDFSLKSSSSNVKSCTWTKCLNIGFIVGCLICFSYK